MRTLLASLALLLITVGTARAEFQAPGPQVRHQFAEPMADLNERAARMFNKVLDVEQTIYLTSDRCGEANAFYLPAKGRTAPTVVLCSELARDVLQEFRHENLSRRQLQAAIQGNMVFILLHEVGHALIDVLNLPVVGEEENAVDQFSALFMSDMPNLALWAAEYWKDEGDFGDTGLLKPFTRGPFADSHDLDVQRQKDILCYVYGAKPREYRFLERRLGYSAERCPHRFQQAKQAWGELLKPYAKRVPGGR